MKKGFNIVALAMVLLTLVSLANVLALPSLRTQNKVYIEKSSLYVGEENTIGSFTNSKDISIEITDSQKTYTFLSINGDIKFVPKIRGAHDVALVNLSSKKIIDKSSFLALPRQKTIYTDKKNYTLSENVKIIVPGFESDDKIIVAVNNQNYVLINPKNETNFAPQIVKEHTVYLYSNKSIVASNTFNVYDAYVAKQEQSLVPTPIRFLLNLISDFRIGPKKNFIKMTDSLGKKTDMNVEYFDSNENLVDSPIINQKYRSKIYFDLGEEIQNIELNELNYAAGYASNPSIEFESVPQEKIKETFKNAKIEKAFSIDPTLLDFRNGTITATAKGNLLFKCKDWIFYAQRCSGSWDLIQKLTPGQKYTINFDKNDPAYIETGLTSINTNKSIYHPSEDARIIIVVLDTKGYLVSGANVILNVTRPNSISDIYTTQSSAIKETQKGIYEITYSNTLLTGNYTLSVHSQGPNTNYTMDSFFYVQDFYEYDILRTAPVTTDPFSGPITSKIKVVSNNETGTFNLSEKLPLNFTIVDSGGAIVSNDANNRYLTWINLNNNSEISYSAQPPLITPQLWELGQAVIRSANKIFQEIKSWFLAIDPVNEIKPTNGTTAGGSNILYAYDGNPLTNASIPVPNSGANDLTYKFFNITGLNNESAINSVNITYSMSATGFTDDTWTVQYSTNAGSSYTTCYTLATNLAKQNVSCIVSFTGNLQQFYENFTVRGTTSKTSGADAAARLNLFEIFASINYTLPNVIPYYRNYSVNQTTIFVNDTLLFNATWNDTDGTMDTWIFSWNITGQWFNYTVKFLGSNTSNITLKANASAGTLVNWLFFANDSRNGWNQTPIQSFIIVSSTDAIAPVISNEAVTPTKNVSGTKFNITADVTDNQVVQSVWADITNPQGTTARYPLSSSGGTKYSYLFQSNDGGNFSFIVNASDGTNTNISRTRQYFNVTPLIYANTYFYGRGEIANITGIGFYSSGTVSLNILDESGISAAGYPVSISANSNGNFTSLWSIPSSTSFAPGNFTINGSDNTLSWLKNSTTLKVVIKPNTIMTFNDQPGNGNPKQGWENSFTRMNQSDNLYQQINGSSVEVFAELNFTNVLPAGYNINNAFFYFEHYELSAQNTYIKWLNSTAGAFQTICTITNQPSEVISGCNLSRVVTDSNSVNSLSLRISDDATGTNDIPWTLIDFAFLDLKFNVSMSMSVTINEPKYSTNTYNYSNTNNKAYGGSGATAAPPTARITGTEATSLEYTNLTTSNDGYFHSSTTTQNQYAYQSFKFIITDAASDIASISLTHEGYVTAGSPATTQAYTLYLWNYTSAAYQSIQTATGSLTDQITTKTLQGNSGDFINASNGEVWFLVESDNKITGSGGGAREDIWTDFAKLDVNKIPTLSGNQNINATALDGDGVAVCNYYFLNSTGQTTNPISMKNYTNNIWYNLSNTRLYPDGFYTLYVNCTDIPKTSIGNGTIYVKIANSAPVVLLVDPPYYSNLTYSNINFTWNVTQLGQGIPVCNLTVDNSVKVSNMISNNGFNTTQNITLTDGAHYWNVTCKDSSGVSNTSSTWIVDVDTQPPAITLNYPSLNLFANLENISFNFTPTDTHSILNCSLTLDGKLNQTSNSITKGSVNSFPINNISEGTHNWSINCTDSFLWMSNTSTRNVTIDRTFPWISLNKPDSMSSFTGGNISFNFTVYDNIDKTIRCNLTLDSILSLTNRNFNVNNATLITINETGVGDGMHYWNITCIDNSGNLNFSETRNFSMTGPPSVNLINPQHNTWKNNEELNLTFYVQDGDGISKCVLLIDDKINQTKTSAQITNYAQNTFNITNISEGKHSWTVNCTDNMNSGNMPTAYNFTADRTKPAIALDQPINDWTSPIATISFNFTVTDNLDGNLTCNITIDNVISSANRNFRAENSTLVNISETVGDGVHYWNITCADDATNSNTSETRNFTIDGPPNINSLTPIDNSKSKENVTFKYYVSDMTGLLYCSLLFDYSINQTKWTENLSNYGTNRFNITNIPEGKHVWTINCSDLGDQSSQLSWLNLQIDMTPPQVIPKYPNGSTFNTNTVRFNFTAIDGVSTTMNCNVSVDNGAFSTTVSAQNNSLTSTTISSISDGLHKWNVTCLDEANNSMISTTLNFTTVTAPEVYLEQPQDGQGNTSSNMTFTYQVFTTALSNCSLIINDKINQTKLVSEIGHINDGQPNNFTLENMTQAAYNWTVNCTDTNEFTGTQAKRKLYIDWTTPYITLNNPQNNSNLSFATVNFNFTSYDNLGPETECNLSVYNAGGFYKSAVFNASINVPTVQPILGFVSGIYNWNVTCKDKSSLQNSSETWTFTLISTPTASLISPANNSANGNGNIVFWYLPQDLEGILFCDFYFDSTYNYTRYTVDGDVHNGYPSNFTLNNVGEGNHPWYVNCTDTDANTVKTEPWNIIVDKTDPWISVFYPNGNLLRTSSVFFNWTATDNVAATLMCNLTINSTVRAPNIASPNNSVTNTTVNNLLDGVLAWNITCLDSAGRKNTSATFTVDVEEPPTVALSNPALGYRTKIPNVTFFFTPNDNSGFIRNCSVILNSKLNVTNYSITLNAANNITSYSLPDNQYNWSINCSDPNQNIGNSSTKTIYVDLNPPWINLTQPYEGQAFNTDDILFNWTAFDMWGTNLWCNLTLDLVVNITAIPVFSGVNYSVTIENLSLGRHNYTITCWDDLNWTNSSDLVKFIVNAPDLTLNQTDIVFNNTNPNVNETIQINATIYNKGGYPAFNAVIDFWDGDPLIGIFIGNTTINQLDPGKNITVNVTWNITQGLHTVWVVADLYDRLVELNDTNNNQSKNISTLVSKINSPLNASWTNNLTNTINFTGASYLSDILTYKVFVDGAFHGESGTLNDDTTKAVDVTLTEGIRKIVIEVNDSLNRKKNSTAIYLIVDRTSPSISWQTLNQTWFNTSSPIVNFTITDNLDVFLNYTLYLNNEINKTGVANSSIKWNDTLLNLADGEYLMNMTSYDDAGNLGNSSVIKIFIDTAFPYILLNFPENDYNFTYAVPSVNFTAIDNMDLNLSCNVSVDGASVKSLEAPNNTMINITISGLIEGVHYWNVTCYDNATNKNTSITNYFNLFIPPLINLTYPANKTWTNNENTTFFFNVSDTTGIENCSILINDLINQTKWTQNITNGGENNLTVEYLNGTYNWSIECYDNSSFFIKSTTEKRLLYVDIDYPEPKIGTANQTWFNTATPLIYFNVTDNMDTLLNYTFYADGVHNKNGTVPNGTASSTNLNTLSQGAHKIILEVFDEAKNTKNSSEVTIYVDTIAPYIALNNPNNDNLTENDTVVFNFTAFDATSINLTCNLSIDNSVIQSFNTTNSTSVLTVLNVTFGLHYWNVTCLDMALNKNTSATYNFTVPAPDLMINSSYIFFNETSPAEGSNITINATILNLGKSRAKNVIVQFWDGNWSIGTQIGNNISLNLSGLSNVTVGVTWTSSLGNHDIYVVIDPIISTNGSIKEENESNNYAYKSIGIQFWHFFFGNVTGMLKIGTQNDTVFSWSIEDYNGSIIFAADTDNNINWLRLKELGLNVSNQTEFNDFAQLDTALNSTIFPDSVNRTYTSNNNIAKISSFVVFGYNMTNVSVANSTNTSNFLTGILWDSSQNSYYNGTQDVVFISEAKKQQGTFGFYDYEIRVPATLRDYKGATKSVSFYSEIN